MRVSYLLLNIRRRRHATKKNASRDPYLYEDCDVLKNKFNIKNTEKLEQVENEYMRLIMPDIDSLIHSDKFDYERLEEINKRILGDVYEWAGAKRTIPIVKGEEILGGDTVRYSPPDNIEKDCHKAINALNSIDWNALNHEEKTERFSKLIAELWQAHPFREGNTRTVMTFACQFADKNGFPMNRALFAENAKYLRNSLVKASDGQYSEYKHLEKIIGDAIQQGASKEIKNVSPSRYAPKTIKELKTVNPTQSANDYDSPDVQ